MSNFIDYANYYDLLYKDKNYTSEVEYIAKLLQENSEIEIKNILDFGCGTGKHDIILSDFGYQLTGIDISAQMINLAQQKQAPNCIFIQNDILNLQLNKEFDAVLSLFHVASYQKTFNELEQFLQSAHKHLKTNGLFIFDFWYGPAVLTDLPSVRIKRFENELMKITRLSEPELLTEKSSVNVHFEVFVEYKNTNEAKKINEIHTMRYWFLPELVFFAQKNGFKLIDTFKWLTFNKINIDSWNGVIVLKKL